MAPIISLEELASYMNPRAPRDLSGDVLAEIAIDAATESIRTLSEQTLTADETTATYVIDRDSKDLILPQMPVVEVDEIRVFEDASSDSPFDLELDYVVMAAGVIHLVSSERNFWPMGARIEVDYSHGYDEPPPELRLLALTLAARAYQQGIARQESTGSTSVTYSVASSLDLSLGEKAIVAKYRHPKAGIPRLLPVPESS